MSDIVIKGVMILVLATIAGYMFGPAIQGWVTANTLTCYAPTNTLGECTYRNVTNPSVSWINLTVMPIIIGVAVLLILVYNAIQKKK